MAKTYDQRYLVHSTKSLSLRLNKIVRPKKRNSTLELFIQL